MYRRSREALRCAGKIECRVYDQDKFHAKAYITHAKLDVVGAQALVGSSNFTRPGLTKTSSSTSRVQSAREVAQLQEWFEDALGGIGEDVLEAILGPIARHTRPLHALRRLREGAPGVLPRP